MYDLWVCGWLDGWVVLVTLIGPTWKHPAKVGVSVVVGSSRNLNLPFVPEAAFELPTEQRRFMSGSLQLQLLTGFRFRRACALLHQGLLLVLFFHMYRLHNCEQYVTIPMTPVRSNGRKSNTVPLFESKNKIIKRGPPITIMRGDARVQLCRFACDRTHQVGRLACAPAVRAAVCS